MKLGWSKGFWRWATFIRPWGLTKMNFPGAICPASSASSMLNPTQVVRVLVVDDFPALADHLVKLLSRAGYSACAAYDGVDALRVAADFQPHAVLSDFYMPRMNG